MSGGSFNYLCHATCAEDIVEKRYYLEQMAEELERRPGMEDAAVETRRLLLDLQAFDVRVQATTKRIGDLWHAVEWQRSSDYGQEQVDTALAKYRGLA